MEPDTHGEIQNTQFTVLEQPAAPLPQAPEPMVTPQRGASTPGCLSKLEAMEQAGNDVTKAFKVGKGWRFLVFDHVAGQWQDSPLVATEQEAERMRQKAFKERFEALQRGRH